MVDVKAAWQGDEWDRISTPHVDMGAPVLDRLGLEGDERVLDAGCGSGRITELLMERLPAGTAIALDGSTSMLLEAHARLARYDDRVTYVQADLAAPPLPIERTVDAAMATATFHWILDHDALFEGLAGAIRPGGRFSFRCGGEGNAAGIVEAV